MIQPAELLEDMIAAIATPMRDDPAGGDHADERALKETPAATRRQHVR